MPHSVFTGRVVADGEPLFLPDDTAKAVALAEEERDTCGSCGYPKSWCRDPAHQFSFEPDEEFCWPSYRLADYRRAKGDKWSDSQKASVQLSVGFRDGLEPDVDAGLDLPERGDGPPDQADGRQ